MGSYTNAAVVPFKLKDNNWNNPVLNKIIVSLTRIKEVSNNGDVVKDGWKYYYDSADRYKDYNNNTLYCDNLDKGDKRLFVVNEDPYSAGGGETYCVFGDNLADLEELCLDWGIDLNNVSITANNIAQQTG